MKTFLMISIIYASMLSAAFGSGESISKAVNLKEVKALEEKLKNEGFVLKTVIDEEAGAAYINKCGCSSFVIQFLKSSFDKNNKYVSAEREYYLTMDHINGDIELEEI